MRKPDGGVRLLILALVAIAVLAAGRPASVAAQEPSEEELLEKVEKGGTPADHAALSAYYRNQAKAAATKATHHEAMARQYAPVMAKTDWVTHCRSLASYYRKLAEEYEAMAKLHEGHAAERPRPDGAGH